MLGALFENIRAVLSVVLWVSFEDLLAADYLARIWPHERPAVPPILAFVHAFYLTLFQNLKPIYIHQAIITFLGSRV